ncbi:unnamed protein product [Dibothriocephalus latus]|uniref:Uncharacterized protein n=1 Tax=Dibothriocephalus latus TaxID=60516 RepID=A0A3P7LM91_DIBLA|nr:unnamed protein product [Dibothriocephalus latus]
MYKELLHKSYRFPEVGTNDVNLLKRTNVAARLEGHEKNLRNDIQLLGESMDQNSEEQTTLDELLQLIGKIRDAIQQFQSLGRMYYQEKEQEATVGRSSGQTSYASAAAAATVAEPSGAQKSWSATTTTTPTQATNSTESRLAEANDISRTLEESREAIQLFRTLQQSISTSSVHVLDGSQLQDLQVVAERLKAMQEKVQSLINAVVGGCSADITEDVETALADLMSVNDELLHCIENYQRTAETDKLQAASKWTAGARTFEAAAATSTAPAGADISAGLTTKTPLTEADDVQQTLLEAREALQQFNALQQHASSSSAQVADPTRMGDLKVRVTFSEFT